jgi:hypothetical protein
MKVRELIELLQFENAEAEVRVQGFGAAEEYRLEMGDDPVTSYGRVVCLNVEATGPAEDDGDPG